MQTFASLVATLATITAVSGTPVLVARNICGTAPTGSGSQAPIQQPANIQNAAACQSACSSNGQCQSFVFGMADNAIKCMLFSVPAAQVPKQGSSNLVAFDKACSSVPSVTPTTSNPTGANQGGNNNNNNNGNGQPGQQTGNKPPQQKRNTCGATPAGSNSNQAPLSQPAGINSAGDCLAKCKADPSCKSFEFGTENGAKLCKLFNVAASGIPPPANGQSLQAFDVGCSV